MSFRGSFEHAIDDKGRVSVPARFRDVITASNDDRVVITNFQSDSIHCLDVYPYPAWVRLEDRIRQQPQFSPRIRYFHQYYIARAQDCQLDKQGRVLIPPILRQYAQLDGTAMFTGAGDKFQIWDPKAWEKVFGHAEGKLFEDEEMLTEIGF